MNNKRYYLFSEYATSIAAGKCQNFDFDRTKNIDGYKIIAVKLRNSEVEKEIQNPRKKLIYEKKNYPEDTINLTFYERELATAIQQALNVSLVFPYEGSNNDWSSSFKDVIKANSAYLAFLPFNYHYYISVLSFVNDIDLSYPITMVSDVIVTHNRKLAPPLAQLNNSYVHLMAISILVIILITFIVIYSSAKINNNRLSFACFECLRLLIRNRLSTQMNTLKVRMFFFMVFIYFLLMIEIFSGYLTAFLIKPEQQKNAETTYDLLDPRYKTIYFSTNIYDYYKDPTYEKYEYETECENFIKNNESVACIIYDKAVKYINIAYDLHVSKKALVNSFFTIPMRRKWSLRMRIDNVIMHLVQSGITDKWYDTLMRHQFTMLRTFDDHIVGGHYYRTLNLDDLMVAFVLLASGLMLSVIIFIIEIIFENDFIHDIILGKYDDIYM